MYKLLENDMIKKIDTGESIPMVDGNRHYEKYKVWLAEGNTPEAMDESVVTSQQSDRDVIKEELKTLIDTIPSPSRDDLKAIVMKMADFVEKL